MVNLDLKYDWPATDLAIFDILLAAAGSVHAGFKCLATVRAGYDLPFYHQ